MLTRPLSERPLLRLLDDERFGVACLVALLLRLVDAERFRDVERWLDAERSRVCDRRASLFRALDGERAELWLFRETAAERRSRLSLRLARESRDVDRRVLDVCAERLRVVSRAMSLRLVVRLVLCGRPAVVVRVVVVRAVDVVRVRVTPRS